MKKAWQMLWARRPRLGRRGRTVRNLVLSIVLAAMVWGQYGWPLPTVEMEFRRLERQYLLPRSEVAYRSRFWSAGGVGEIQSRDGAYLSVFEPFIVGVTQDQAYSVTLRQAGWHTVTVAPLGEKPAPVPVNSVIARVPEPGRVWMSGCNLLFLQVPREMARAELDVDVTLFNDEQFSRRAQEGLCLEDGVWLFSLEPPEGGYSGDWYEGAAYTLRLYREDGGLLLEQSGVIETC